MPTAPASQALSAEAQHVIDSLEAHLGAIVKAAQNQSPALVAVAAEFGDEALAKLEAWGLSLRGKLQSLEAASPAAAALASEVAGNGAAPTAAPTPEIPVASTGSAATATAAGAGAASPSEPAAPPAAAAVPAAATPAA
jgi:hypothetical protein